MSGETKHLANEPEADYEKAELDLLRDGLRRTHEERFKMMTTLMKIGFMLKKAKITQKHFITKEGDR